MNCKPNDRCVIVWDECRENVGAFVTVRRIDPIAEATGFPPSWVFDGASRPLTQLCAVTKRQMPAVSASFEFGHALIPDSWLIPIKGDDITKEEVEALWLPTPSIPQKEEV